MIPYDVKRKCVGLAEQGKSYRQIYDEIIKGYSSMSFLSFRRRVPEWREKMIEDSKKKLFDTVLDELFDRILISRTLEDRIKRSILS
jgi:hypothetical protein